MFYNGIRSRKEKIIFFNKWFVNEKNSTIGVDISSYQADVDKMWMSSFYTPLRWNYKGDWYVWQYLNRGILEGYTGGERYIDLNVLNKQKDLSDLIVK